MRKGEVVKRLRMDPKSVQPVGERFIPFLITMETLRTKSRADVRTLSYELAQRAREDGQHVEPGVGGRGEGSEAGGGEGPKH